MNDKDLILGLFYSDEDNLIYERFSQDLSDESEKSLKMLSYKFLGPLFFTAASGNGSNWKIESIDGRRIFRHIEKNYKHGSIAIWIMKSSM